MSFKKNILVIFILFSLWYLISYFKLIQPIYLPHLFDVFLSLNYLLFTKNGFFHIFETLKRTIISFIFGLILGIFFGLFFGMFKLIYSYFEGLINFFRSVPATAMFPLFIVFFGFGNLVKIMMGIWASSFVMLINTLHGVWNAKKNRIIMAKVKGASKFQILKKIIFFESLPYIFAGMRISVSWNLIVIIVAEMFIGTSKGLGKFIYDSSVMLKTESVIAGIIIIGTIGILLNSLILLIENKLIHWKGQ
jgi:ABC-type nitrate/sulfonate/bicarbonate transport system permease component